MGETQTAMSPPNGLPPCIISSGDYEDNIKEIGDRIAALSVEELFEVVEYIASIL